MLELFGVSVKMLLIFGVKKYSSEFSLKTIRAVHLFFVSYVADDYLFANCLEYFGELMLVIWSICGFDYDFHVGERLLFCGECVNIYFD